MEKTQRDIDRLAEKIGHLNGGGTIVDIPALQGAVGDFMGGWYATIMFLPNNSPDTTAKRMEEAKQIADNWLGAKLKSFDNLDND